MVIVPNGVQQDIQDYVLKLFKNDIFPSVYTLLGDFVEANFENYSPQVLVSTNFQQSPPGVFTYNAFVPFTCTSKSESQVVYGVYALSLGGALLWSERLANAEVFTKGATFEYKPVLYKSGSYVVSGSRGIVNLYRKASFRPTSEKAYSFEDAEGARICSLCGKWAPAHFLKYVDGKPYCIDHPIVSIYEEHI